MPAYISFVDQWTGLTHRLYFTVRLIRANSTIQAVAGRATTSGYAGDGGSPLNALINPYHAAPDGSGGVLIDDGVAFVVRRILPASVCANPMGVLDVCSNTSAGAVACGFVGLAPHPPMYVWLAGVLCSTTTSPTAASGARAQGCPLSMTVVNSPPSSPNRSGGVANATCPMPVGAAGELRWLTQLGSASKNISLALSISLTPTATSSQLPSGSQTGSTTSTATASQISTSTVSITPSYSGTPTLTQTTSQFGRYNCESDSHGLASPESVTVPQRYCIANAVRGPDSLRKPNDDTEPQLESSIDPGVVVVAGTDRNAHEHHDGIPELLYNAELVTGCDTACDRKPDGDLEAVPRAKHPR